MSELNRFTASNCHFAIYGRKGIFPVTAHFLISGRNYQGACSECEVTCAGLVITLRLSDFLIKSWCPRCLTFESRRTCAAHVAVSQGTNPSSWSPSLVFSLWQWYCRQVPPKEDNSGAIFFVESVLGLIYDPSRCSVHISEVGFPWGRCVRIWRCVSMRGLQKVRSFG